MSVHAIEELRHKRAAAFEGMKSLNDKALNEERDLTSEEAQEYERRESEFDQLTRQIERAERIEGISPEMTVRKATGGEVEERSVEERRVPASYREFLAEQRTPQVQDSPEYRQAFYKWIGGGNDALDATEKRVMSKASGAAGAYFVPTDFASSIIEAKREFGPMRQVSTVIRTESGEDMDFPSVTAFGTAAWTAENAAFTASDDTVAENTLGAYKAGRLVKVSWELLQDSAFDLESWLRRSIAASISLLENTAFTVGDGSGKPTGVVTSASAGVTAAGAAAITADELIDLYHSLAPQYRQGASWQLRDSTVKLVRKLKDGDSQYLWQPGLQAGEPDTLLGKPVHVNPDIAAAATGQVSALFGDFSYYVIRDVAGVQLVRLDELYAENGQVGFIGYTRTDGELTLSAAVKKLTQA